MAKETKKYPLGKTQEDIDSMKRAHGEVSLISVNHKGIIKNAYLKKPDRNTLASSMKFMQSDPMRANEIILSNCWIDGDAEIKNDDNYFMGACTKLAEMFEVANAELVKL